MRKPYSRIPRPRVTAWTAETLIERIHAWYDLEGQPPRVSDWNPSLARRRGFHDRAERFETDGCWPFASAFERIEFPGFGRGFSAGIRAAGLEARAPGIATARAESDGTTRSERNKRALGPKAAARADRNRQIVRLAGTMPYREIAARYGLTIQAISLIVRAAGVDQRTLRARHKAQLDAAHAAICVEMISRRATKDEIADALGIPVRCVSQHLGRLRHAGHDIPHVRVRARDTETTIAAVIRMIQAERTDAEIAEALGFSSGISIAVWLTRLRREGHDIPYRGASRPRRRRTEERAVRARRLTELIEAGRSNPEIAEPLGYKDGAHVAADISTLRRAGFNIPYRDRVVRVRPDLLDQPGT